MWFHLNDYLLARRFVQLATWGAFESDADSYEMLSIETQTIG